MTAETVGTGPGDKKPMNIFSRIINVFVAPQSTFEAEREQPKWLVPFIIYMVLMLSWTAIVQPVLVETQREAMMEQFDKQNLSEEQREQAMQRAEQMRGIMTWVGVVVSQVVMLLIVAAVWLFVSNVLLGGGARYVHTLSITAYSWLIIVVGLMIKAPIILNKNTVDVHFSPATFLSDTDSFVYKLLSQFDLFNIWSFFIVSIGIAVVTRKRMQSVWPWVAIIYLVYFVGAATVQNLFAG